MQKPLIGITTSYEEGRQQVSHAYVEAIEQAQGLPVLVPMFTDRKNLDHFTGMLDGLIITGGPAITQGLVGDLPPDLENTDPIRTRTDQWIVQIMMESRKPVLGICYGMQLINALTGGTIFADVQRQVPGVVSHSSERGGKGHDITINPSSLLCRIMERPVLPVNSRHIQAIATTGSLLKVSATAPDGVVEAIETEDGMLMGVQFHPESLLPQWLPLFRYLVQCATRA